MNLMMRRCLTLKLWFNMWMTHGLVSGIDEIKLRGVTLDLGEALDKKFQTLLDEMEKIENEYYRLDLEDKEVSGVIIRKEGNRIDTY